MYCLMFLNLTIPFVMILVGSILKEYPVSDMGNHSGYNTPVSRRSQEHWDYAQSIAPDIFINIGKILAVVEIIFSMLMFLCQVSIYIALAVGLTVGFGFMLYGFYKADSETMRRFAKS